MPGAACLIEGDTCIALLQFSIHLNHCRHQTLRTWRPRRFFRVDQTAAKSLAWLPGIAGILERSFGRAGSTGLTRRYPSDRYPLAGMLNWRTRPEFPRSIADAAVRESPPSTHTELSTAS